MPEETVAAHPNVISILAAIILIVKHHLCEIRANI